MKPQISTLIVDLDNTLYDWLGMWYAAFNELITQLAIQSGVPKDKLESEIRPIFQEHGTSEYSFVVQELPSLKRLHPGENLAEVYSGAILAYRKARKAALVLYPTVLETLNAVKKHGCQVAIFTESLEFYSINRVRNLELDGIVDILYCPPDHDLPDGTTLEEIRYHPPEYYQLQYTRVHNTPAGEKKPDPRILLEIITDMQASPHLTCYVGDSLMKDILMAQDAAVIDVWAKYGAGQATEAYEQLRRVSHWTEADVRREKDLLEGRVVSPSYILQNSFSELLELFDFDGGNNKRIGHGSHR